MFHVQHGLAARRNYDEEDNLLVDPAILREFLLTE